MSSIRETAERVTEGVRVSTVGSLGTDDIEALAAFALRVTGPETRELIARYLYTGGGYTPGEATGLADDLMSLICEGST